MAANMHNDYADRKNGRKPVEYLHPDAEEILADTYGPDDLPGVGDAGGAEVRRLLAGRGRQPPQGLRQEDPRAHGQGAEKFVAGCEATGYGASSAEAVRHHRAVRRLRLQQEPLLRLRLRRLPDRLPQGHYPVEYLAALLTSVKANLDKAAVYLAECRTMGIEVLVPDVNRSRVRLHPGRPTPSATTAARSCRIVFGLSAVRNVGEGLVASSSPSARPTAPSPTSTTSASGSTQVLNKKTIESLIKAGGFDSLGHPRQGLLMVFEQIIDPPSPAGASATWGHVLFGDSTDDGGPCSTSASPSPTSSSTSGSGSLREGDARPLRERPPAHGGRGGPAALTDCTIADLAELDDGTMRTVGGVVTGLQRKWTKKGDLMAVFQLEDLQTSVEVMVFPKTMPSTATSSPTTPSWW
jgi:DNA polymerase III subunit alpha